MVLTGKQRTSDGLATTLAFYLGTKRSVYRPRIVRHRIGCYAAMAAGESWLCRTAAGV